MGRTFTHQLQTEGMGLQGRAHASKGTLWHHNQRPAPPLRPLPWPGNITQPKAVDRFGPEVLSAAWADLGNERSPFMRKQGAMRALAALAHASLTSRPGGWGSGCGSWV